MKQSYPGTPQRTTLLRAARAYARRGIPVFPCKPGGKEPLTPRGFHDATTDESRVHLWWNRWPLANIGVPTGERSGILALDVDHPAGLDALESERGALPATATTATGSGGMHYLYRYPAGVEIRNSAGKLGTGLDIRGEGGYIIAPPSRTTRPYEWLDRRLLAVPPEWLIEMLRAAPGPRSGDAGRPSAAAAADLDSGPIPEGTRNGTLVRIAGRLHDGTRDQAGFESELLAINARRCAPPLPERKVLQIARWALGKPPCRPARGEAPEVAEILEAAGRYWYGRLLPGSGRSKLRDVYRALIRFGGRHGELVKVRIAGEERRAVRFTASCRQVAPEAGTTPMSVSRNTKRLRAIGAVRKDDAERHDTDGGTFLIVEPAHQRYTPNNPAPYSAESQVGGCNTSARPPRPDELRTPAPRWGDHVGNARAGTLYALEAFGPQTPEELAERIGLARARDIVRRHLEPLAALGLVEDRGGAWALRGDYRERTGELRRAPYSTVRPLRRNRRTSEGRILTEVVEVGCVASVEDRDRADLERYAAEAAAYRERRRRPAGRTPTTAEMDVRRQQRQQAPAGEIRELERLPALPEPHTLTGLIDSRVDTPRGPGVLWDHKGDEARVVLDSDPSRWVPIDVAEVALVERAG